jgi:hypothetical protein
MPDTNYNDVSPRQNNTPQTEARRMQMRADVDRRAHWTAKPASVLQQRRRGEAYAVLPRPALEW